MKEDVAVPDTLLRKTKELQKYLDFELRVHQDVKTQAHEEEVLTSSSGLGHGFGQPEQVGICARGAVTFFLR
jgi:hypothetical protein